MKLYLTNQEAHFSKHLEALKQVPVMLYNRQQLREKNSRITLQHRHAFDNPSALFQYTIFPKHILDFYGQWQQENRGMQAGDTIVQQVFLPPLGRMSQKVIFGVRVKEIIHEPTRIGFSYETLEGHVEKGLSIFTLELKNDQCIFHIQTFSAPGHWLTRLLGPVATLPYQAYCTRQALLHVQKQSC